MKEVILNADIREEVGTRKSTRLRWAGFIPAIVYGGKKPQAIKISRKEMIKFLHEHKGENVIIDLRVGEHAKAAKDNTVMIKDIQYDPVSEEIIHLDFNHISLTKTITVKVPVEIKGEAPGIKLDGGVLEHVLWELEIECLPKDLPKFLEADISSLKIGDAVHVKDLKVPEGVKVKHISEAIVLSVAPPAKEETGLEETLTTETAKEPEVLKEKKEVLAEGAKEEGKAKEVKEDKK